MAFAVFWLDQTIPNSLLQDKWYVFSPASALIVQVERDIH